jgi:DNA mismatch endonuclease, patch repair protein
MGRLGHVERWIRTDAGRHLRGRQHTNTGPELALRRALHALGARFRLHRTISPGCTPDVVLPRRRIAVFVDGDYWHGCPVHGRQSAFTGPNAALWEQKMRRNRDRDARATALAEAAGWTMVRVWECSVQADPPAAATAVLSGVSPPPVASPRIRKGCTSDFRRRQPAQSHSMADQTWQNKNRVCAVQGPSVTVTAVRRRATPIPS